MDIDIDVEEALLLLSESRQVRKQHRGAENARKIREMAARLGIKEAAARKRLQRAQQLRTKRVTWQVTAHQDDREAIDRYIQDLNRRRVAQERTVAALKSQAQKVSP